jgi:alcohol dehydrogenase class IV
MPFEFATAARIIFGAGTIAQAGALAAECGRIALVVTGRDSSRAQRLVDVLREKQLRASHFSVDGEPDLETVRRGVALAKHSGSEFVIAMGGGSALDTGKVIAAMLANDGDVLDYLEIIGGGKPLRHRSAPFIAIPTTSGTGSEVTRNAVLSSPEHRVKASLRSPLMLPTVALVDPELTRDLPPPITARTGLDALTQLIEPFTCLRANPMTDALCVKGLRAARSLRAACENGDNDAAREDMALASLLGGLALSNSGLGAVHGLAGAIGGMFPTPHGVICAALLPHAMRVNLSALSYRAFASPALARYEEIAQLLTGHSGAIANDGIDWVRQLVADLQIPKLRSFGMARADFAEIIEKARNASSMKANPIVLTHQELVEILEAAL